VAEIHRLEIQLADAEDEIADLKMFAKRLYRCMDYPNSDFGHAAHAKIASWGHGALREVKHVGECAHDAFARQVCDGVYAERVEDNLALCEALRAVYTLCGENKDVKKLVHDSIQEHGIDDC
jgi:hypothetical protein